MEKTKLLSLNDFISGSIAGIIQVLLGQPLDMIKVRMQTNPEINKSMVQTAKLIYKNEGLLAFYKGTLSPLLGISFCVAIQFGSNEFAKKFISKRKGTNELSVNDYVLCGIFAGFCNSFAMSPVELFRIKMQCQSDLNKLYSGTIDCATQIYKRYGIKGIYQGLGATFVREIPAYSVYFGVYNSLMMRSEKKYGNRKNIPLINVMGYGGLSGFLLWFSTFPMDVIKSRMQADSLEQRKYKTFIQTTSAIFSEKGLMGFYKGLTPCLIRSIPINAATFLTFETVQKILRRRQSK
jgi:solute carrier family 25 carnitine/acylcarnitine transporter 20/29